MFALSIIATLHLPIDLQKVTFPNGLGNMRLAMSKQYKEQPVSSEKSSNAPARDGNIAIREEFDLAVKAGTKKALEIFILRHPDHELSVRAALMIEKIKGAK